MLQMHVCMKTLVYVNNQFHLITDALPHFNRLICKILLTLPAIVDCEYNVGQNSSPINKWKSNLKLMLAEPWLKVFASFSICTFSEKAGEFIKDRSGILEQVVLKSFPQWMEMKQISWYIDYATICYNRLCYNTGDWNIHFYFAEKKTNTTSYL